MNCHVYIHVTFSYPLTDLASSLSFRGRVSFEGGTPAHLLTCPICRLQKDWSSWDAGWCAIERIPLMSFQSDLFSFQFPVNPSQRAVDSFANFGESLPCKSCLNSSVNPQCWKLALGCSSHRWTRLFPEFTRFREMADMAHPNLGFNLRM